MSSHHTRSAEARLLDDAVAIRVAVARLQRQLRARMGGQLTPSQSSALARLEQYGALRLGTLAEHEGTSAAAMSKIVASLEDLHLVERAPDATDGRATLLALSPKGGSLLRDLRARGASALASALDSMSAAERTSIRRALPALDRLSALLQEVR